MPEADWSTPDLYLYEREDRLRLTLAGAIQYHGITSIGGIVLGFRLIQYAVELAAGDMPLERSAISIYTAFPGNGTKDAFEYTCRAIRDHRYCCDNSLKHPAAQSGIRGQFLFVIRVNEQSITLTPALDTPTNSYFEADRNSKKDAESALTWRNEKINFANHLLRLPPSACLRAL